MIPATISTAPTMCMNVDGAIGITFVASGLRYISQFVKKLKYLSMPAIIGPSPRPIRNTHQLLFKRPLNCSIARPPTNRANNPRKVTVLDISRFWCNHSGSCHSIDRGQVMQTTAILERARLEQWSDEEVVNR